MAIAGGAIHRITIQGTAGVVRLGYQRAATLGAWKVEGEWFVAAVTELDAFRITQSPLTLEIPHADGTATRRPLADVVVSRGELSARLLPKRTEV